MISIGATCPICFEERWLWSRPPVRNCALGPDDKRRRLQIRTLIADRLSGLTPLAAVRLAMTFRYQRYLHSASLAADRGATCGGRSGCRDAERATQAIGAMAGLAGSVGRA